jgi:hypothetical protein
MVTLNQYSNLHGIWEDGLGPSFSVGVARMSGLLSVSSVLLRAAQPFTQVELELQAPIPLSAQWWYEKHIRVDSPAPCEEVIVSSSERPRELDYLHTNQYLSLRTRSPR